MLKKDNFIFGLLLGTLIPLIVYVFLEEVVTIEVNGETQPRFDQATNLVLALVANVLPFRQYMQKGNYEKTGKGILLVTFIFAIAYMILKFRLFQ
jgi:uncharacterized membrane protein YdjX (TVP38/TMEM64 family)